MVTTTGTRFRCRPGPRGNPIAAAAVALLALPAAAFDIDTGVPDLKLRWDTQLRYTLGFRTRQQDPALTQGIGTINFDDGNLNFSKRRRPMTNRIDLYTEADVTYRGLGARVSAAGWYDAVYERHTSNDAQPAGFPPPQPYTVGRTLNGGTPNDFPDGTRKLHGHKTEVLDAFVFGQASFGGTTLSGRLGQHALLWGESLFFGFNAIAAAMAPLDVIKAQSSPNVTVKEIIRPTGQLSAQWQLGAQLSVGGFVQYEWEKSRLPSSGSYFNINDTLGDGGERLYVPLANGSILPVARMPDTDAPDSGQGGVQLHWRPAGIDIGLYAVRWHAKLPVGYLGFGPLPGPPGAPVQIGPTGYRFVYPEDIKTYGASLNTTFGDVNVGAEASTRRNTPLTRGLLPLTAGPGPFDASDNPAYPVGRTAHVNVSALWAVPTMPYLRESSLAAEVAWNRVLSCDRNCTNLAPGPGLPTGFNPRDGNAERNAWGLRIVYTPTFRQISSGVDLSVPLGVGYSPKGKSGAAGPVFVDKGGDITVGLAANVQELYQVSLGYTHYYGPRTVANDGNGYFTFGQSLRDRDFVTLSARVAF